MFKSRHHKSTLPLSLQSDHVEQCRGNDVTSPPLPPPPPWPILTCGHAAALQSTFQMSWGQGFGGCRAHIAHEPVVIKFPGRQIYTSLVKQPPFLELNTLQRSSVPDMLRSRQYDWVGGC